MNPKDLLIILNKELQKETRKTRTIKGIKNFSYSDIETMIMYIEYYINNWNINRFTKPLWNIKELFNKFNIN